jgi:putative inorganic carbon (hco3(-)) transporter
MVSAPYEVEPGTTRPRRMPAIVVSGLGIAGTTGLLLARGPVLTVGVVLALAIVAALILNVELAALAFIAMAPFEGYAKSVSGAAVKALGAVLFVAWVFRVLTRGTPLRLAHPAVRAAGVLLAALLASTVLHQNGALGTQVLVRYLSYLGALVVLVDCMQDRLAPQRVARVYVAACSAAAFVGLIAFFRHNLRASGPVGDPNDFAFFLLAALPLCIALRHDARRRRLYDVAALTMMLAVLATLSRGALIGIAAMLAYAMAAHWIRAGVVIAAATLAGIAALGVLVVDPTKLSTSLHAKGQVAQQNVDERLIRWEAAAEMTYDNPLLGLGPAGFRENYDRYIDYHETNLVHQLDVAHEMYLEVSSELGVTGLVAFLCVMGFGYRGARERARGDGAEAWLAGAVCAAFVGTAVAAVFLTEQYFLPIWLLAAVGAAMQTRTPARAAPVPPAISGSTGMI